MGTLTIQDAVDAGYDIAYTAAETFFPYRTTCTHCAALVDTHYVTSGLRWAEQHRCRSGRFLDAARTILGGTILSTLVLVIGFAPSLWVGP